MVACVVACAVLLFSPSASAQRNDELSGPITTPPRSEGSVEEAAIRPDGRRIVYVADQDTLGVHELYGMPLDGSAGSLELRLPPTTGDGRNVSFQIVSDSRRVGSGGAVPLRAPQHPELFRGPDRSRRHAPLNPLRLSRPFRFP